MAHPVDRGVGPQIDLTKRESERERQRFHRGWLHRWNKRQKALQKGTKGTKEGRRNERHASALRLHFDPGNWLVLIRDSTRAIARQEHRDLMLAEGFASFLLCVLRALL
jgi:hypothetical protein